jgi:hypothetical protein
MLFRETVSAYYENHMKRISTRKIVKIYPRCLTSALDGDEWSSLSPGRIAPKEIAFGTRYIGVAGIAQSV